MGITLLEIAFLSVWVVVIFVLINRKNIRLLKKLAPHFNGSLASYSVFLPALEGVHDGLKFSIHISPKFLEVRGTLRVRLWAKSFVRLRVFRRSVVSRTASKTGLFHRVMTGDSFFDSEFFVFAREAEIVRSYLQHSKARQVLQQLFGYGFSMLVMDLQGSWTDLYDYDRETDLELNRVSAVLDILKTLSTGI